MIQGSCHCGAVQWRFERMPQSRPRRAIAPYVAATACCGPMTSKAKASKSQGPTQAYVRGKSIGVSYFLACGCVAYWRSLQPDEGGRRRIAVNLRLTEPEAVAQIPIDHFDGLESFKDLPRDGRCVADYWF